MGVSALHQALKNFCLNTDWNYAVFWKLNPQARMMLTCEDAYYDKNDPSGSKKPFDTMIGNLHEQDLLDLAVAKMSFHRYSLGKESLGRLQLQINIYGFLVISLLMIPACPLRIMMDGKLSCKLGLGRLLLWVLFLMELYNLAH